MSEANTASAGSAPPLPPLHELQRFESRRIARSQIKNAQYNPRKISAEQRKKLLKSLEEFGLVDTLIWNERTGNLVGGHQRLSILDQLSMRDGEAGSIAGNYSLEVSAIDIDLDREKALNVILNARGAQGDYDASALNSLLAELQGKVDFALDDLLSDTEKKLAAIGSRSASQEKKDSNPRFDDADTLREKYAVTPGQIWQLGSHRLMCGDSTNPEHVRALCDLPIKLVFTSPPYSDQRDYRDQDGLGWDLLMNGVFANIGEAATEDCQILVNLGLIHADNEFVPYWNQWLEQMKDYKWRRFAWYVWDQGFGMPGDWNGRFAPSFEFIFHFNKVSVRPQKWIEKKPESVDIGHGGGLRKKSGAVAVRKSSPEGSLQPNKIPDNVIRIVRHQARGIEMNHPAVFPVDLPAFFMKSWPGATYEPFSGSGTTLIAAENENVPCRAMEISPAYVAVALQRWADATGQAPQLLS